MSTAAAAATEPGPAGRKIGPLYFHSYVPGRSLGVFFFTSFFAIASMNAIGVMQPYIFTEILKIPPNEQGSLAGNLTIIQEIVAFFMLSVVGAISDRSGRRTVFAAGFVLLAIGYCLYPLASGKVELAFFRLFLASGVACINAMLPAVANDYSMDVSRAKVIAATFILNGLGIASIPRLLGGLPNTFMDMGADPVWAGRFTLWCLSAFCLFLAGLIAWGLMPGAPAQQAVSRVPLKEQILVGFREGKNPRVGLAYVAAFVARADLAVVSTFLTLWLTQEGIAQGLSTGDAIKKATFFYVIIQVFALPWAPIWGYILDRVDRVAGLASAMVVAALGYVSLAFLDNPIGNGMYIAAALVAAGEMAANIASISLIGYEAPERARGAVIGVFSLCGAVGIAVVAFIGGWLFDNWTPVGPFVYMAASNALLFCLALGVLVVTGRQKVVKKPGGAAAVPH
jgi:MFS family permease